MLVINVDRLLHNQGAEFCGGEIWEVSISSWMQETFGVLCRPIIVERLKMSFLLYVFYFCFIPEYSHEYSQNHVITGSLQNCHVFRHWCIALTLTILMSIFSWQTCSCRSMRSVSHVPIRFMLLVYHCCNKEAEKQSAERNLHMMYTTKYKM